MSHPRVLDFHVRLAPVAGGADRLLATLDACGVERAAVCAGGVLDLDALSRQLVEGGHVTADADNDAVLDACAASGGRLVPFYFGNPHRGADDYASRAQHFVGLEVSPAVHGAGLDDPRVLELVRIAVSHGHAVYIVCIERAGCRVSDFTALARRFPEGTFVLGHSGVGNIDLHGIDRIAPVPNTALETSGGYTCVLRAALERLGPERVLFGSEYPLQHPSVELAKFRALDLPAPTWELVAWVNAHRVLKEQP